MIIRPDNHHQPIRRQLHRRNDAASHLDCPIRWRIGQRAMAWQTDGQSPIDHSRQERPVKPRGLTEGQSINLFKENSTDSREEEQEERGQGEIGNLRSDEKPGDKGNSQGRQHRPPSRGCY